MKAKLFLVIDKNGRGYKTTMNTTAVKADFKNEMSFTGISLHEFLKFAEVGDIYEIHNLQIIRKS